MRTEARTPWTPYPPLAATALIALVVGALWWEARDAWSEPRALDAPAAAATAQARKAAAAPVPAQVTALVSFAQESLPVGWPDTRAKTASGLKILAGAIAARGDSTLWRDRALRLEEAAAAIEKAPDAEEAASRAQGALVQAADWVEDLRPAPDTALHPAMSAAEAIDAREPLRDQAKELEDFFDAVAQALGGAKA
jgi:hypothetical protein